MRAPHGLVKSSAASFRLSEDAHGTQLVMRHAQFRHTVVLDGAQREVGPCHIAKTAAQLYIRSVIPRRSQVDGRSAKSNAGHPWCRSGGIQEYVTRSGTDAVHGAAFFNSKPTSLTPCRGLLTRLRIARLILVTAVTTVLIRITSVVPRSASTKRAVTPAARSTFRTFMTDGTAPPGSSLGRGVNFISHASVRGTW